MRGRRAKVEVFLSHSSRDRRFILKLAGFLRSHGIDAWYAEHHITGAQDWHDAIGRALKRVTHLAVVLSPNSVRSTWVYRELVYALVRRRFDGRIIPILHRTCDVERLSWALESFQQIDFRRDFDRGGRKLLRTLRTVARKNVKT